MKKLYYPAVFHIAEEGGFWITFPDLPECITEGDDLESSYDMASDVLGLVLSSYIEDKVDFPKPSSLFDLNNLKEEGDILVLVAFDLDEYRKKYSSKSVKKTLTIPEWLNEEALKRGLNFSKILQDALIDIIYSSTN